MNDDSPARYSSLITEGLLALDIPIVDLASWRLDVQEVLDIVATISKRASEVIEAEPERYFVDFIIAVEHLRRHADALITNANVTHVLGDD